MHELSLCHSLLTQVEGLIVENNADKATRVVVRLGPLSGVEPALLRRAYPLAVAGSAAEGSLLEIETLPVRVRCGACDRESEVPPNRLLCPACGDFKTSLMSGDEMILATVDLEVDD